ncbi:MAG TPA: MFS transporter [Bryobacteraceae bacterium]|nr:MFS transporter [Bryobacteraceae bacterium]
MTNRPAAVWGVVCLLSLGFTIAYIDRTNLSIALASPSFKQAFGLNDTERGMLNSAFFWSYALCQIPAGFVTDRFGVRWPYAVSFALWSIVSAATAFATALWHLVAFRLLLGVGEAIITPASMRWITTHVPERNRGLAVGILFAGSKFGPALGAWLAVELMSRYGWQTMFLILGLGSLAFLLPWFRYVHDDDSGAERKAAATAGSADFAAVWRTPAIYGILAGTVAYNYFNYFNLTWLPAYFAEHWGLPLSSMGAYTAFSFLGMAAVAIAGGAVADSMIRRGADPVRTRKAFTIAGLAIASTEIIGSITTSRDVAVTFAIISMAGLGLTTANYWALTQTLMPGGAIGRISGVQNFASNLAGVVAPALTGWLIHVTGSYVAPMRAILFVLLGGIAAYVLLVKRDYAPSRA